MMNLAELQRKLIAAARARPPGDRVPYAFAKRVMALLPARPTLDPLALWARALWRAAAACLALTLLLSMLTLFLPATNSSPKDLTQAFENTMLAPVSQDADSAPAL
jgi:hypothetical protein